jgi:hypothetical protein
MAPITGFRRAIERLLRDDAIIRRLTLPQGGVDNPLRVAYRMAREQVAVPSITFFDFGTRPDNVVPLHRRTLQVDIWTETLELCEEVAVRVDQVLTESGPLTEALWVAYIALTDDRDNLIPEGFLSRKTLMFEVLAYERSDTGLVGTADMAMTAAELAL